MEKLFPIVTEGGSDSAAFDSAVELLFQSGRSLPHVMAMLIPEAWSGNPHMDADRRAFYEYHASLMEPWDGPAAMAFTDGRVIGAMLDRNGLRPGRYVVTNDDVVVLASEAGVVDVDASNVRQKGRLQPGKMFLVDTIAGRIVSDEEIKQQLTSRQPYAQWIEENQITLEQMEEPMRFHALEKGSLQSRQRAFGYTEEDLKMILTPMAAKGEEPVGSMGTDTPLACLSDKPQLLFNYFKQLFAQVTNPPIDPIREEMVMSLTSYIGTERNILEETPRNCHTLKLPQPVLTNRELEQLRRVSKGDLLATTLVALFRSEDGEAGLRRGLDELCRRASLAVLNGYTLLILSDRGVDEHFAPIPSLLALAAVQTSLAGGLAFGAASFTNYLAIFTACATLAWLSLTKQNRRLIPASSFGIAPFLVLDTSYFLAQRNSRIGQFVPFSLAHALTLLAKDSGAALFGGLPLYAGSAGPLVTLALLTLLATCLSLRHRPPTRIFKLFRFAGTRPAMWPSRAGHHLSQHAH